MKIIFIDFHKILIECFITVFRIFNKTLNHYLAKEDISVLS